MCLCVYAVYVSSKVMCGTSKIPLLLLLRILFSSSNAASDLDICLSNGCVRGTREEGVTQSFDAFYGIPYATPPVGPLRFRVRLCFRMSSDNI